MPVPSLATIYDFESAYEDACANYLANVNTSWQILTPRTVSNASASTDFLRTPRVLVKFNLTGSTEQREWVNGVEYYACRTGTFTLQGISGRNDLTQNHGLLRGSLRVAMLERTAAFNANTLPYYQTADIMEGASQQGYDRENEEILTELTFHVTFFIPPSSVP